MIEVPSPSSRLRERYDVAIVGGGLIGTATAYFLAREGADVVLLEQGDFHAQASGANAGSLHLQIPMAEYRTLGEGWAIPFAETLPLMREAVEFWRKLPDMLGHELEMKITGGVIAARSEAEMAAVRSKTALEQQHGVEVDLLNSDEIHALAPYLSPDVVGGAYCPGEGKANPLLTTQAFVEAAAKAGATLCRNRCVEHLEGDGDDYRLVVGEQRIRAARVINAAGARAGEVAAMLGIDLPVRGFPIQVSATESCDPFIDHLVYSAAGKLTVKQMANGTCLVGGGWPSTLHPDGSLSVDDASLKLNMRMAVETVPALAGLRLVRTWPAIVNGNDNWRPVIGEVSQHPGFFLSLFPWMGFTAGPLTAQITAELVLGRKPSVDIERFSALA